MKNCNNVKPDGDLECDEAIKQGFDMRHPPDCSARCYWLERRYGTECPQNGCRGVRLRTKEL